MRSYEASTVVNAAPSSVWAVVADTAAYPSWDSGVTDVRGDVRIGARLKVRSAASPGRAFAVKVSKIDPERRMVWIGGMPLGLFRGVRRFDLHPEGARTRFTLREDYSGPLLPLIWRTMPDLQPSFEQFVAGLKRRVEERG